MLLCLFKTEQINDITSDPCIGYALAPFLNFIIIYTRVQLSSFTASPYVSFSPIFICTSRTTSLASQLSYPGIKTQFFFHFSIAFLTSANSLFIVVMSSPRQQFRAAAALIQYYAMTALYRSCRIKGFSRKSAGLFPFRAFLFWAQC